MFKINVSIFVPVFQCVFTLYKPLLNTSLLKQNNSLSFNALGVKGSRNTDSLVIRHSITGLSGDK